MSSEEEEDNKMEIGYIGIRLLFMVGRLLLFCLSGTFAGTAKVVQSQASSSQQAGVYKNLHNVLQAAGMITPPSYVKASKKAWKLGMPPINGLHHCKVPKRNTAGSILSACHRSVSQGKMKC